MIRIGLRRIFFFSYPAFLFFFVICSGLSFHLPFAAFSMICFPSSCTIASS